MDPTASLTRALEALGELEERHNQATPDELEAKTEEHREEAVDCLLALAGWLRGGGFPPDVEQAVARAGFATESDEDL